MCVALWEREKWSLAGGAEVRGTVDSEVSHSGGGRSKKNGDVVAPLQLVESWGGGGFTGGTVGSGGLGFQVAEVS